MAQNALTKDIHAKRSILVVEDNELNREILREILGDSYRIIEAADGKAGIDKLRENFRSLSLVLLDVQMPVMNGYEFLEQYRNDELLMSVPVIVTTGSSISEDEEKCLALGASDFVTKPYNPGIIKRRIEAIIRLNESIATLNAVEYDSVSGLYTRNAFYHHAQNYLQAGENTSVDMMMLNIEDFSYINEHYGQSMGNQLLKYIGKCIMQYYGDSVVSCRYHADRYVLMRNHIETNEGDELDDFDSVIHANAPISDFNVKYAVYNDIRQTLPISVLCDRLAMAIKTIRHQYNTHVAYYDDEMSLKFKRLREIEDCMETALAEGQFKIYYQPKHDAKTGRLSGAEALVRWFHPEYGFLPPDEFIPLFEENGFITKLDLYILESVCRDLKKWQSNGIDIVPVSVNASRRDFVTIKSIDDVVGPIDKIGIDKSYLHVEVTESLEVGNENVIRKVRILREAGIKIEIDDFGSGQSSLSTICDIPMDIIKLDVRFVRGLQKQKDVVKMIISLAHDLGCKIVAEGVESEEQIAILKSYGCDYFQGYYYSKPIPENEFMEYLKIQS